MTKLMNNSHAFSIKRITSVFVISFLAVLAAVFSPQSAYAEEGESDGMARPELYEQHSELWQKDPVSYTSEEIEEMKRQQSGGGLIDLSIQVDPWPYASYSEEYGEWLYEDYKVYWEPETDIYANDESVYTFLYASFYEGEEYRYWYTEQSNPLLMDLWGLGCFDIRARMERYNPATYSYDPVSTFSNQEQVCLYAEDTSGVFFDVPPTYGFHEHIESLANDGIVSGYENGFFNPNQDVSRAQMAKFIRRAYAFNEDTHCGAFPDVPETHTFYTDATTLKCRGIISGYEDGTFRPDERVLRGQSMKFIMQGLRVKKNDPDYFKFTDTKYVFNDVNPGDVFYEQIMAGYDSGIVSGYSSEYFGTNWYTTRGAMSKMIDLARSK